MKTAAVLVAVAMVAMVTPLSSADEECDNEAYWNDILTTRPEVRQYTKTASGAMDAEVVSPPEPSPEEAAAQAEFVAPMVADLVEHSGGVCMEDLVGGAAETGGFPQFGNVMLVEVAYDFTGQHCSPGGGEHYGNGSPLLAPPGWGVADSEISLGGPGATAYYSSGFAFNLDNGKAFAYAQHVNYVGSSDFWCIGFFDPFFGDYVTINNPMLDPGFVW